MVLIKKGKKREGWKRPSFLGLQTQRNFSLQVKFDRPCYQAISDISEPNRLFGFTNRFWPKIVNFKWYWPYQVESYFIGWWPMQSKDCIVLGFYSYQMGKLQSHGQILMIPVSEKLLVGIKYDEQSETIFAFFDERQPQLIASIPAPIEFRKGIILQEKLARKARVSIRYRIF